MKSNAIIVMDYEYIRIRSKKIPILLIVDTKKVIYYKTGLNSIKQEMQTELEKVKKWFRIITSF